MFRNLKRFPALAFTVTKGKFEIEYKKRFGVLRLTKSQKERLKGLSAEGIKVKREEIARDCLYQGKNNKTLNGIIKA